MRLADVNDPEAVIAHPLGRRVRPKPSAFEAMLCTGDLNSRAMVLACERSHRFQGIQPNSGHRDYSRLSCGVEDTQLGPACGDIDSCAHAPCQSGYFVLIASGGGRFSLDGLLRIRFASKRNSAAGPSLLSTTR